MIHDQICVRTSQRIGLRKQYQVFVNTMRIDMIKCDLHLHTTLSDGKHTPRDVVDLFGKAGFDVIAITDHIWDIEKPSECSIPARDWDRYLWEIRLVKEYAWQAYEMLVIPGIELTNQKDKYHIIGLDVKDPIDPALPVLSIIAELHDQNALAIAAHPGRKPLDPPNEHTSQFLWEHRDEFRTAFDAWEVANRDDLYNFEHMKKCNFRYVASSDFHYKRHLYGWKTLIDGTKNTESVKAAIKYNLGIAIWIYRKEIKAP